MYFVKWQLTFCERRPLLTVQFPVILIFLFQSNYHISECSLNVICLYFCHIIPSYATKGYWNVNCIAYYIAYNFIQFVGSFPCCFFTLFLTKTIFQIILKVVKLNQCMWIHFIHALCFVVHLTCCIRFWCVASVLLIYIIYKSIKQF